MTNYICIEGNIGAGKTTLAKALSARLNARLVLEEFEDNGFLEKFYRNPKRYAFPLEMSFLSERYKQLQEVVLPTEDLFQNNIVADYSIYKCLLFAKNNLEDQDFKMYQEFFNLVVNKLKKPDLIIFLQRPLDSIIKNIRTRNRQYELDIAPDYLINIGEKYDKLFKQHEMPKVLTVRADEYDFINNNMDVNRLVDLIGTKTG